MGFEQGQNLISAWVTSPSPWIGQGRLGMVLSILVIVVIIVVLLRQLVLLSNRTRAVAMVPIGDWG